MSPLIVEWTLYVAVVVAPVTTTMPTTQRCFLSVVVLLCLLCRAVLFPAMVKFSCAVCLDVGLQTRFKRIQKMFLCQKCVLFNFLTMQGPCNSEGNCRAGLCSAIAFLAIAEQASALRLPSCKVLGCVGWGRGRKGEDIELQCHWHFYCRRNDTCSCCHGNDSLKVYATATGSWLLFYGH